MTNLAGSVRPCVPRIVLSLICSLFERAPLQDSTEWLHTRASRDALRGTISAAGVILGLLVACPSAAQSARNVHPVDSEISGLVSRQDYARALVKLNSLPEKERIDLLLRHAEDGHVPMAYELAAILFPSDVEQSLKWYARGRLARIFSRACSKAASCS